MMLPVKKEYQPSLPPISQIIEAQNFTILKPTVRAGSVRKEKEYFSSWKNKVLRFLFVPDQKLVCQILNEAGSKVQETLNFATAKLSKKCSEVDDKICFGVVTPTGQKYLIALKSNRECSRIFNELSSAKKILTLSMFKSQPPCLQKKYLNASENQRNQKKEFTTEEESNQPDHLDHEDQSAEKVQKLSSPIKTQKQSLAAFKDYSSSQSQMPKTNTLFQNLTKDERQIVEQCKSLEQLKGFKLIKEFQSGSLYQNSQKVIKAKLLIYSPESAKEIFSLFYQFEFWNHQVKKFNKVCRLSNGVYKFYLQFHKNGCFSAKKCCEVLLSLSKWDNDYYLVMNSTAQKPEYVDAKNWVNFSSCAKIKSKVNNPREKQVYVCLSSMENSGMLVQFGKQLRNFPDFIKGKASFKELQIRNINDK